MKILTVWSLFLATLWAASVLSAGEVYLKRSARKATLGNDFIELKIDWSSGPVRLASVTDRHGATPKFQDDGFALQVGNNDLVTADQCPVFDVATESTPDGPTRLVLMLRHNDLGLELRLAYSLASSDFFVRKTLAVRSVPDGKPLTVYRAEIARLRTGATLEPGGQGQPIFLGGRLFLGLEFPAAQNQVDADRLRLVHFPGKRLGRKFLQLKTEVIGVAGRRSIEDAFAEYIRRIRIPPRSWVLYNSWYDIRRGEMSNDVFIKCFEDFRRLLIDRYDVQLDSFVVDDGYQDRKSIWKTDRSVVPGDFGKLADYLRSHGSRFGIWMPLTAPAPYLNVDWGKQHGYEVVDSGNRYCISGPKYRAALRQIIAYHIKVFGLNYYKHDFNSFACRAAGHGHLPDSVYGFESNVDAYIETLQYARQLNPDIFLNVTGGMWLSPWWLMYVDAVWRGGGDTGREGIVPYIQRRDDTMTYVDGVIWDRVVRQRLQFPTSALMTHGIIYGRRAMLGGKDEPLHCWADHVVAYHGPGLMMKELYITPSILSEGQWSVLGPTLAWAVAEQDVLVESKMTHGNPHAGEVYGYLHAKSGRLIWFLRNPSIKTQEIVLNVARPLAGPPDYVAVTYPYQQSLESAGSIKVQVGPFQTMVIEASRKKPDDRVFLSGCRHEAAQCDGRTLTCELVGRPDAKTSIRIDSPVAIRHATLDGVPLHMAEGKQTTLDFELSGKPEPAVVIEQISVSDTGNKNRVRIRIDQDANEAVFAVLCEKVGKNVPMGKFQCNGKPAKPKVIRGDGWQLWLVPLDGGTSDVSWEVPLRKRSMQPFAQIEMTVSSLAFLRRTHPTRRLVLSMADDLPAVKALPTPFASVDPICVEVQPRRILRTVVPNQAELLSHEVLAGIKAVKLHVKVFDVNGGDQYGHKPVLLNGEEIGILPANVRRAWEEKVIDVPAERVPDIRVENTVVFTNPTHDPYKVTDIGLALQLADSSWIHTRRDQTIHCSVPGGWIYAEGTPFRNERSASIRLVFPVRKEK